MNPHEQGNCGAQQQVFDAVAFFATPDTLYVPKPIPKCVRVA